MTPQETANHVGVGMMASDFASIALGISLTYLVSGSETNASHFVYPDINKNYT